VCPPRRRRSPSDAFAALRAAGRHEELVEALVAQLGAEQVPRERAKFLLEISGLFRDRLGDPAQAFDAALEAWTMDPTWDDALDPLEGLANVAAQ
jgi:hypothetical protein